MQNKVEQIMDIREGEKMVADKNRENETELPQVAAAPGPFPLFPFGLFLFPLIVPGLPAGESKEIK